MGPVVSVALMLKFCIFCGLFVRNCTWQGFYYYFPLLFLDPIFKSLDYASNLSEWFSLVFRLFVSVTVRRNVNYYCILHNNKYVNNCAQTVCTSKYIISCNSIEISIKKNKGLHWISKTLSNIYTLLYILPLYCRDKSIKEQCYRKNKQYIYKVALKRDQLFPLDRIKFKMLQKPTTNSYSKMRKRDRKL